MEKIFGENSNWSIFIMSIIFYSFVYYRRIGRGIREIKIPSFLENVLFPFSKEGKAALGCIIIAYIWYCQFHFLMLQYLF